MSQIENLKIFKSVLTLVVFVCIAWLACIGHKGFSIVIYLLSRFLLRFMPILIVLWKYDYVYGEYTIQVLLLFLILFIYFL